MALQHYSLMSVEEYLQLDRNSVDKRYEYIDGYVTMMSGGTLDHATIGANVISILRGLLRGSSCRVFTSDARVRLSEERYVYPDATVSCAKEDRGQSDIVQQPRFIVEVLSPSTEGYDRGQKFAYYRDCPTIQEYLVIDAQRPMVEIYRREKHGFWLLRAFHLEEHVDLNSLGVRFPVAAIYEDVTFPPPYPISEQ
jgi:Uma2 family endonuclease